VANSPQSNQSFANVDYTQILNFAPWLVLAVVLLGGAQFDSTSKLSAAFAYLILVAAILFYGPQAIANVNSMVGSKPIVTQTPGGGGGIIRAT
jgi:hypothetical protein